MSDPQYFALFTAGPTLAALIGAWIFIHRRRTRAGLTTGLVVIWLLWLIGELWWFVSCNNCTEYAGLIAAILFGIAIIDTAVVLLLVPIISWLYTHRHSARLAVADASEYKPRFKTELWAILILVAMTVMGAFVTKQFTDLKDNGFFVNWHNIGGPQEKAIRILKAGINQIHVETTVGTVYFARRNNCRNFESSAQGCWETGTPDEIKSTEFTPCRFQFYTHAPPQDTIDQYQARYCFNDLMVQTDYALLDDGNVWVWRYEFNSFKAERSFVLSILIGAVMGFVSGAVVLRVTT